MHTSANEFLTPRTIDVTEKQLRIQAALQISGQRSAVDWIEVDSSKMIGTFKRYPDRAELPSEINENLIVELYSK